MIRLTDYRTIEYQIFKDVWNIKNKQVRDIDYIDESLSLFKGQVNIVVKVATDIMKKLVKFNKDFTLSYINKDFDNVEFFKNLQIICKSNINSLANYNNDIKFDNKTNQIEKIIITINTEDNNLEYSDILSLVGHEIKHAWQDYQAYINKSDLTQYVLAKITKNITKSLNDKNVNILTNIIYRCFKHETDAFTSELALEISQLIKNNNPTTLQDCLKLFRKTKVFEEFSLLLYFLDNTKEDNFSEELIQKLNIKLDTNYTWKSFKTKYYKSLNKAFQRLCNTGAQIFWKYTDSKKMQQELDNLSLTDVGIRENRGNLAKRLKQFYQLQK